MPRSKVPSKAPTSPPPQSGPRVALTIAIPLCVLLLAIPLIVGLSVKGRQGFDHLNYHLPAVQIFAHDWREGGLKNLDLVGYLSATTPGYHLALAAVDRFISPSEVVLRFAGSLFTLALVGLFAWVLTGRTRGHAWMGAACAAAFAASPYVFTPAAFLLPDNAGWLLVLCVLLVALRPKLDWIAMVGAMVALAGLICMRQSHAWAAGVIVTAFWMGSQETLEREAGGRSDALLAPVLKPTPARLGRALAGMLAVLPAAAVLWYFARLWNGLVPPLFQTQYKAPTGSLPVNLAAPAFVLALVGVYSPFFIATYWSTLRELWATRRRLVWTTLAIVGVLAIGPATLESRTAGRSDALWRVTGRGPQLFDHVNVLIVMLALWGSVALLALLARVDVRTRVVVLVALAGFAASQAASFLVFQRYCEPMVLMSLGILVASPASGIVRASAKAGREPNSRAHEVVGPAMLALLLAMLSGLKLSRETPDHRLPREELMDAIPTKLTPRLEPNEPRNPGALVPPR